jgi:hypothetical protein
MMIVRTIDFSC